VTFTSLGAVDHDLGAKGERAAPAALKVLVDFVAEAPAQASARPNATSTATAKSPRSP
jgi:hypothetical protein